MSKSETYEETDVGSLSRGVQRSRAGASGVWIVIFGDMIIFALFFTVFLFYRSYDVEGFTESQATLNQGIGLANTLVLLVSSWLVVCAVQSAERGDAKQSIRFLYGAIAHGLFFCALKVLEYREKILDGHYLTSDPFFGYYFMYTGIHLVHVTAGLCALMCAAKLIRKHGASTENQDIVENVGAFWHLVDLLWIALFALLYLAG